MTLEEATDLARKQADEFRVDMIVVKGDLSSEPGGYECCAEMYRTTLYPDHHQKFWEFVGRCEPSRGEEWFQSRAKTTMVSKNGPSYARVNMPSLAFPSRRIFPSAEAPVTLLPIIDPVT